MFGSDSFLANAQASSCNMHWPGILQVLLFRGIINSTWQYFVVASPELCYNTTT